MSTHTRIQRFDATFLRDFFDKNAQSRNQNNAEIEKTIEAPPPPPAPTFSEEELAAAKKRAYDEGFQEGQAEGLQQGRGENMALDKALHDALLMVSSRLEQYKNLYADALQSSAVATNQLALKIAEKILMQQLPESMSNYVGQFIAHAMPDLIHKPAITLQVHPSFEAAMAQAIMPVIEQLGFKGDVHIRPDPSLGEHDVTLAWDNGKIEQHFSKSMQEISRLVDSFSIPNNISTE